MLDSRVVDRLFQFVDSVRIQPRLVGHLDNDLVRRAAGVVHVKLKKVAVIQDGITLGAHPGPRKICVSNHQARVLQSERRASVRGEGSPQRFQIRVVNGQQTKSGVDFCRPGQVHLRRSMLPSRAS
jgi:hypothetical protein